MNYIKDFNIVVNAPQTETATQPSTEPKTESTIPIYVPPYNPPQNNSSINDNYNSPTENNVNNNISDNNIITEEVPQNNISEKIILSSQLPLVKPEYWNVFTNLRNFQFIPARWTERGIIILDNSDSDNKYFFEEFFPNFSDVSDRNIWYYENVNIAASKNLVFGINEQQTIFNPDASVTRAEFSAMIV